MFRSIIIVMLAALAIGCGSFGAVSKSRSAEGRPSDLSGTYDNHEQVWASRSRSGAPVVPHAVIDVRAAERAGWSIWHVRTDGSAPMEARWAMRLSVSGDDVLLVPHRALGVTGERAAIDPAQWVALDACALRGTMQGPSLKVAGDPATCVALVPGIGAEAALLPLSVEQEGEWLRVRFYADQARGPDARIEARRVRTFTGWAALNGAGPDARADSNDWHTDDAVRIGSEGGRHALRFRDGQPSGYSLRLERLTFREGREPVLKLSVIADADGATLAYAWANPEATRIGISLGWVQVGLQATATR